MPRLLVRSSPFFLSAALLFSAAAPASAARPPQQITCASTITRDAVLTRDLSCDGPEGATVVVARSGVTLDLGGHNIFRGFGTVIRAEGVNRVTIRNGNIGTQGLALSASGHGDRFVDLIATGDTGGMYLHDGHDNTILRGEPGVGVPSRSANGGIGLANERDDRIRGTKDFADLRLTNSRRVHVSGSEVHEGLTIDAASHDNGIATSAVSTFEFSTSAIIVQGDHNRLVGNTATFSPFPFGPPVPTVQIAGRGNRLIGNTSSNGPADGIGVLTPGNVLIGNLAENNGALGINAVPGTRDGGGNRASGNGDARECVGVHCTP